MTLLRDADNQPWRIVGVVEDITEHLRLEEAERAREAAEASNRAEERVPVAHEPRAAHAAQRRCSASPSCSRLDQRHPLAPAQRPWVGQIQQAGWHLLEMINDVLDLSRIESGNLRLQPATLDLPELLGGDGRAGRERRRARAASASARTSAPGTSRHRRRRDPGEADPDQPAEQRRQVQHRRRPHPRRQPRWSTPTASRSRSPTPAWA